jgi:hypothetical protein
MSYFDRFWFELNPGQFFDGWVSLFTVWYIFGYFSVMFRLSTQAKERSTLRSVIEHSDAAWAYVSFLFIPFVIFTVIRAAFVAMN